MVEVLYRLQRRFDYVARGSGIVLFTTFGIYMTEIVVSNDTYKLYEGFLVLGSVEFLFSITITVDIWLCPLAVFLSHTYAFLRIYTAFDKVNDVLCPGLYCPLFHFTLSSHLFNIQSKKDFILTEMHKEMTQRFITILKTFPERMIIAQKTAMNTIYYPFTNDPMTEESLIKDNDGNACESIIRKTNELNIMDDENPTVLLDDESSPLDIFLEEERLKAMESENLESVSRVTSIATYHTVPNQDNHRKLDIELESNTGKLSKRHYIVKTRQIEWKTNVSSDENLKSFLHIFVDITSTEKLKQEKTLREYQRMMLSSVAHEFRNPLNAISGNLQLIELFQDPKIEKYVRVSRNSCTLLNSYVEDILDLGRIEGSAFQLNCEEFMIGEVFKEVEDIFEIELRHKKIRFEIDIGARFKIVKVFVTIFNL